LAKKPLANEPAQALPVDVTAALFAALAAPAVSAAQAARIRDRVDAAIATRPTAVTHRLGDGRWQAVSDGFEIKIVNYDEGSGCYSYLGRLHAGASIKPHPHRSVEECVIVSGDIEVDGMTLGAGDYQVFQAGTAHSVISSRNGALLFLRSELQLHR
jgi:anti-sigma factor ChrR (cupin superfamily)